MATKAYWEWLAAGKPFTLAKPIAELKEWAAAHDVPLLGTIGNESHLTASNPQDHTPFSFTAWPVSLPGYVVTAIDLGNVRGLGQAIEDQARAGRLPWLKYMNHSGQHLDSRDLDGDGKRWEEYPSSDEHVHLSIRTDWIDRSIGTFDPWGNEEMELNDTLNLKTNGDVRYSSPTTTVGGILVSTNYYVLQSRNLALAMRAEVAALRAIVEQLAAAIKAGGGNVDTTAILAGVDERLAVMRTEMRDAVADLGEGGAAQVRGPGQ